LIGDSVFTALKRLGLKYRHETFGERNTVEVSFQGLRRGRRGFGTDFRSGVLLLQFRVGLRVLWHSTGGVKFDTAICGS